jgi:hypothetical protein
MGAKPIVITDSIHDQATSSVPFTYGPGPVVNPSPVQNYKVGIADVQYWNGSGFSTVCSPHDGMSADLQQITIGASAPDGSDQLSVVVASPIAFRTGVGLPVTYTGSPSPRLGHRLSFTAPVNALKGVYTSYNAPTGTVRWIVVPPDRYGPPTPTCASTSLADLATCEFTARAAGTYQAFAIYGGDGNYVESSGSAMSPTVPKDTPPVTVAGKSDGAHFHPTLIFTATIGGTPLANTPTGRVTWAIRQNGTLVPSLCSTPTALDINGTTTCTIPSAAPGIYDAVATYSGDGNYNAAVSKPPPPSVTVPYLTPTMALSESVPGSTITIVATVSGLPGDPAPSGSASWNGGLCNTSTSGLPTAKCQITYPTPGGGHAGTFTYSGDVNYSPATAPVRIPATSSFASGSGSTTLTFAMTVFGPPGGPKPANTVTWQIAAGTTIFGCPNPSYLASNNTATFTCTVIGATAGVNYRASATYGTDPSYLPPYPNPTTIGPVNG